MPSFSMPFQIPPWSGMGRTHHYTGETNLIRRPEGVQSGVAVLLLLQFIEGLSSAEKRYDLGGWRAFVHMYFTDYAVMRLSLTSRPGTVYGACNSRVFELPRVLLPVFFWTNYESGVAQMQFVLGAVKEHMTVARGYVVACPHAKLIYWYANGSQVVAEGHLCVQFTAVQLKMEWFEFIALRHDEYIQRDAAVPSLPVSPVGDLGVTRKTLRCLEIGESLADMYVLMAASQANQQGPLKTLSNFASLREHTDNVH